MFNIFAATLEHISKTILDALTMPSSTAATKLDLESKSFRELQGLCRKQNLPVKGNTEALKKRLIAEYAKSTKVKHAAPTKEKGNEFKPPPKKKPKPSPADDLICPITMELPVEPVVAEDGRTYEYVVKCWCCDDVFPL